MARITAGVGRTSISISGIAEASTGQLASAEAVSCAIENLIEAVNVDSVVNDQAAAAGVAKAAGKAA